VLRAVVLTQYRRVTDRQTDGRTDRQTDGRTDGIAVANTALAMRALRTVKTFNNNNNNLFNSPLSRSTRVSRYQKKHSLTHTLSLWLFCNIFNQLSPFSMVHSILLAYLSGMRIFFYDFTASFLWPAFRSCTFHFNIHAFSPNHSFLKHAHTILTIPS